MIIAMFSLKQKLPYTEMGLFLLFFMFFFCFLFLVGVLSLVLCAYFLLNDVLCL